MGREWVVFLVAVTVSDQGSFFATTTTLFSQSAGRARMHMRAMRCMCTPGGSPSAQVQGPVESRNVGKTIQGTPPPPFLTHASTYSRTMALNNWSM